MKTSGANRDSRRTEWAFGAAAAAMLAAVVWAGHLQTVYRTRRAEERTASWNMMPRLLTLVMLDRYGPPDRLSAASATWFDRPPWKRVVVRQGPAAEALEETVDYDATGQNLEALKAFGRGVRADPAARELSARSDSESANFLALNLGADVLQGARAPGSAGDFYAKTIAQEPSGKSSAYGEGLLFEPLERPPRTWAQRGPF